MIAAALAHADGFRRLARRRAPPRRCRRAARRGRVAASASEPATLFGGAAVADAAAAPAFAVPRAFLELAEAVICHRDPERFALLYALLLRLRERAAGCSRIAADPLVRAARGHGEGGAARHPQDARLRPLPRGRGGGRHPLRRLVRARAPYRPRRRRLLRPPLRQHGLVDPDARAALHWDGARCSRPGRRPRRRARRAIRLEAMWRTYYASHLQSGAAEGRRRC